MVDVVRFCFDFGLLHGEAFGSITVNGLCVRTVNMSALMISV